MGINCCIAKWKLTIDKKTPLYVGAGFTLKSKALLPVASFGSFERINFCFAAVRNFDNMRSNVAISVFPFQCRIRTSRAVPSGRKFRTTITAITFLYDFMANPAVVRTPLCIHKRAIKTFSDRCTLHRNHPLSFFLDLLKKGPETSAPGPARQVTKFFGNITMCLYLVNNNFDGVVKSPIYGVVVFLQILGILHVWPRS